MSACGECNACCTLMAVEEIRKPPCVTCKHLNGNCSIYEARPPSCREFECIWLQMQAKQAWPKSLRPDRCGIMFVPTTDPNTMAAHGDKRLLTGSRIARHVNRWLAQGLRIVCVDGERRTLMQWKTK